MVLIHLPSRCPLQHSIVQNSANGGLLPKYEIIPEKVSGDGGGGGNEST